MTRFARAERAALCDLFEQVGPDAPTLDAGWRTRELAAHLVLRERRPHAAAGIVVRPLAPVTARLLTALTEAYDYAELVRLVRTGPPPWSPVALPWLDEATNAIEFFVHHEDVRRAQAGWAARGLSDERQDQLWRRLERRARLMLRRAPVAVVLQRPDGRTVRGGAGRQTVTVSGEPAELVLYALGRQAHALVHTAGDPAAAQRLAEARLGI